MIEIIIGGLIVYLLLRVFVWMFGEPPAHMLVDRTGRVGRVEVVNDGDYLPLNEVEDEFKNNDPNEWDTEQIDQTSQIRHL